jgi:4-amino-4-deoxy-L-arabinose transferase-like glycosyltransferase
VQKFFSSRERILFFVILLAGVILRLIQFGINRSLWLDEAMLALNIMHKDFPELARPLDYNQAAPVLFLFLEKVSVVVFGTSEMALRLVSLLAGIISIYLVYRLTKNITGNVSAALIAMFLFATSELLIDYSAEVKQYQTDVFAALLILTVTFDGKAGSIDRRKFLIMALAGAAGIFLSHIAVFVLFEVSLYLVYKYRASILKEKNLRAVLAAWLAAFILYYGFFIFNHPAKTNMVSYWQDDFMPLSFFSDEFNEWFYTRFIYVFIKLYAIPFIFIYLISVFIFARRKNALMLFFLLLPLGFHFLISGFGIYPFATRTTLYLSAFLTPALAAGLLEITSWLSQRTHKMVGAIVLAGVLVFMPIVLRNNKYPRKKEEIKDSIAFIEKNINADQPIYLYSGAVIAAQYYRETNCFSSQHRLITGTPNRDEPGKYIDEIKAAGKETWLLFSAVYTGKKGNEEDFIVNTLMAAEGATVLQKFKTKGSAAYLVRFLD